MRKPLLTEQSLVNAISIILSWTKKHSQRVEKRLSDEAKLRNASYNASYPVIISWSKSHQPDGWTDYDCLILAQFVFAWEATSIFFFEQKEKKQKKDKLILESYIRNNAAKIASYINDGSFLPDKITSRKLGVLASFLGHSYVATSKFLHFVYPEVFAMFDSNVTAAINKILKQIAPQEYVLKTSEDKHFFLYQKAIRNFAKDRLALRSIESTLFKVGQSGIEIPVNLGDKQ